MATITPNAEYVRARVRELVECTPELKALQVAGGHGSWPVGFYNCRKISGSQTWSQHSWGNALDIMKASGTPNAQPNEPHHLDLFHDYLSEFEAELAIRTMLYRTDNHWNHIHVDFDPRSPDPKPECAGGDPFDFPLTAHDANPCNLAPVKRYEIVGGTIDLRRID